MINLWQYQEAKRVKITDVDGQEFIGYVVDVTDSGEYADEEIQENGITISLNGNHIEFMQSEIKSIEIFNQED